MQVADYYTHSIATQRADASKVARASSLAPLTSAFLLAALLWRFNPPHDHTLSAGVAMGAVLLILATVMLTHPSQRPHETLVGYSTSGLPLYSSARSPPSILELVRPTLGKILESPDSRRIFYFLLLNLVSSLLCFWSTLRLLPIVTCLSSFSAKFLCPKHAEGRTQIV